MQKRLPTITIILISLFSFIPASVSATSSADDCIRWGQREFDESELEDGYCDVYGYWVPGLITYETSVSETPQYSVGRFTWYNPGRMEDQLRYRNYDPDTMPYLDGVTLESCLHAFNGSTVWLRRPGFDWEGPFIAADCANRANMFTRVVCADTLGELGFETAQRWGLVDLNEDRERVVNQWSIYDVEVFIGDAPAPSGEPVNYRDWWIENSRFVMGEEIFTYSQIWDENPDPREES